MPPFSLTPARRLALLRALFWLAITAVLVGSLLPVAALPPVHSGWDKADHSLAWAVLTVLGLAGWPGRTLTVLAGVLGFGVLVELLQGLSGYRAAEWGDLLADAIGVVTGALLVRLGRARFSGANYP